MRQKNSVQRAARGSKRSPKSRGSRTVSTAVGWREIALALVCIEIAIFVLVLDPSVRDVFDLPKATFTHALGWVLLGVLIIVALVDGVRVPVSPLFLTFYALLDRAPHDRDRDEPVRRRLRRGRPLPRAHDARRARPDRRDDRDRYRLPAACGVARVVGGSGRGGGERVRRRAIARRRSDQVGRPRLSGAAVRDAR